MTRRHLEADVVVAGGGLAGVCATIEAARCGADVILIQDRPMLGGNTSSEVRVHATGADCSGGRPHAREGGIIEEMRLADALRNPQRSNPMWDMVLEEWVRAEPNARLLVNTSVTAAAMNDDGCIGALKSRRIDRPKNCVIARMKQLAVLVQCHQLGNFVVRKRSGSRSFAWLLGRCTIGGRRC